MFPRSTHQDIVKEMDEIECDLFSLYRRLERLRLNLQEQWRVTPDGTPQRAPQPQATHSVSR